jgi:hypothetical protein
VATGLCCLKRLKPVRGGVIVVVSQSIALAIEFSALGHPMDKQAPGHHVSGSNGLKTQSGPQVSVLSGGNHLRISWARRT